MEQRLLPAAGWESGGSSDLMEYVHEHHCVHLVMYHFVCCPKRRRKLLVGPVHDRLKQIMEQVAEEYDDCPADEGTQFA